MSKKILIADDDPANLMLLEGFIKESGFEVITKTSGIEVLDYIQDNTCDLMLLDVMMGYLDGFETCAKVKEIKSDIPVILVTALVESDKLHQGFEAGAVDYIRKPVDKIELIARVNNVLQMKDAQDRIKKLYNDLQDQLQIASGIQTYMLPPEFVVTDDIIFCSNYTPSQQIGGDLFDIIKLSDDKYFVYVGDISGHGVQAALLMAAVKSTIRVMIERGSFNHSLSDFMNKLNDELCRTVFRNNYMTMIAGVIDLKNKSFSYFNAGHPSLITCDKKNKNISAASEVGSIPLGWSENITYSNQEQATIDLSDYKTLIIYTDGIVESEDENSNQLGIDGFEKVLTNLNHKGSCLFLPQKLNDQIKSAGFDLSRDDSTIFAFQLNDENSNHKIIDTYLEFSKIEYAKDSALSNISLLSLVGNVTKQFEEKIIKTTQNKDLAARADVAITEFLNNIIIHAYQKKNKPVIIDLAINQDETESIVIKFYDHGPEWNPVLNCVFEFDVFSNRDPLSESGRGMKMIHSVSNSFKRNRLGNINETAIEIVSSEILEY